MGLLDRLKGVRRPSEGQPARTAEEVFDALLAMNAPDKPWGVRPGDDGRADLIAEWKVTEPGWYGFFANRYMDRTFQILMRLDDDRREVRALDKMWKVTWIDSAPRLTLSKEVGRGLINEWSSTRVVERDDQGKLVTRVIFTFDTKELKQPLSSSVVSAGWTWRPIGVGRL